MDKKKWFAGGLALALVMGGAIYAYADDNASSAAPGDQTQMGPAQKAAPEGRDNQGKREWKQDWRGEKEGQGLQKVADLLGMKPEEVKAGLKSGKSIADLAQAKGISEADLVGKIVANATQRIDAAVKAGKLPQQKADQMKKNLPDRVKKMVERKGLPEWKHGEHGKHGKPGGLGVHLGLDKIAGLLGMTADQLKSELKAGKSIADVASAHGMTKDQLIGKIKDGLTPAIDKIVTRKHQDGKAGAGSNVSSSAPSAGAAG